MPSPSLGLIGYGYWAPKIARTLHNLGALAAVAEIDPARLARAQADYPNAVPYATAEALLADPDLDAVCIATPIRTHAALVEQALRAGKHVFVEKPLCTDQAEAERLIALAAAHKLTLMAGHTYVFHPAVERLILQPLGAVHYAQAEWANLGIVQSDLSVLWSVGPHPVSILVELLGEPRSLRASGARCLGPVEDVVWLTLAWESGAVAQLSLSWLAPRKVRRLTVVGGSGLMACFDEQAEDVLRLYEWAGPAARPKLGDEVQAIRPQGEPLTAELRHFLACVQSGKPPWTGGAAAVAVVRVLAAAQRSIEHGGRVEEVKPGQLSAVSNGHVSPVQPLPV